MRTWQKLIGVSILSLAMLVGCGTGDSSETEEGGGGSTEPADEQETEETVTIGISQFVEHPSLDAATEGFKAALEESDINVEFNEQSAQGDQNNAATIADNLVADNVDLIFANATPSAQAAANATTDIPIVFTSVTDPVGADLVDSMEEPGGNVTGTSDTHPDAIPNTIAFIDEHTDAQTVGLIYNAGEQNSVAQVDIVKEAMEGTDLEAVEATVSTSAEVQQATESLLGRADVFYIITDNTVVSALESVIGVAEENDIPMFVGELDSVARGGFAAYGFDYFDIGYEAGQLALQILSGEKTPAEIPAQYPQNLKLVINKQAAEAMGVEMKPEWDDIAEYIE